MDLSVLGVPGYSHLYSVAFAKRCFKAAILALGEGDVGKAIHNARVDGSLCDFDKLVLAESRASLAYAGHHVGDLPNLGKGASQPFGAPAVLLPYEPEDANGFTSGDRLARHVQLDEGAVGFSFAGVGAKDGDVLRLFR